MKTKHFILAATLAMCGIMTACNQGNKAIKEEAVQTDTITNEKPMFLQVAVRYLADSIAPAYAPFELTIPYASMTCVDGADSTDFKVWGDFWVLNYNVVGDTLKCVSGGNYPGLMHMLKVGENYEVTAFDQVEDGSRFDSSARRIFGDYYDALRAVSGDEKYREKARHDAIVQYVKENALTVKFYQDYGWPAVSLE